MRCPKCHAATPLESHRCPKCKLMTPRGRAAQRGDDPPPSTPKIVVSARTVVGRRAIMIAMALTIVLAGVTSYLITSKHLRSRTSSVPAEVAVEKLRSLPSNLTGFSVDELLHHKVNRSREEGRLLETEGWGTAQLEGSSYLVSFSFEEKGHKQQRAEWVVDVERNAIIPKTDLAAAVYGR